MKELIAYCGLDCENCEARIATERNDDALREKVARSWSEFNHVEITPEMIHCTGCRMPGAKTPYSDSLCPIRRCAQSRGVNQRGLLLLLAPEAVTRETLDAISRYGETVALYQVR